MALLVYGDFLCLSCYLASQRVDALTDAGMDVQWRAIDHAPRLTIGAEPADTADLETQLTTTRPHVLPGEPLPDALPSMTPRSTAAIAGFAEAVGAGTPHEVRRLLFNSYWQASLDIGDPEVLRTLLAGPILRGTSTAEPLRASGYCVSVAGAPITTEATRRIREWNTGWRALGHPQPPVVVEDDVHLHYGMAALARLRTLVKEITPGGDRSPSIPAPLTAAHPQPSPFWVSEVGGQWARPWVREPVRTVS